MAGRARRRHRPVTFTWQDLSTAAGAAAAAALVMVLVQILKQVVPPLFDRLTGAAWAFIGTAAIYLVGAFVLAPSWVDANAALAYFISWVACAVAALGIHGIANAGTGTFVKPAGGNP